MNNNEISKMIDLVSTMTLGASMVVIAFIAGRKTATKTVNDSYINLIHKMMQVNPDFKDSFYKTSEEMINK